MWLVLCLLTAGQPAGVPQLDFERMLEVEPGQVRSLILDALSGPIKARVAVKSPGAPVHVYVVLEKDRDAAEERALRGKRPEKLLAHKEKTEDATLEAAVPARTAFAVLLVAADGKKAKVRVKVTAP